MKANLKIIMMSCLLFICSAQKPPSKINSFEVFEKAYKKKSLEVTSIEELNDFLEKTDTTSFTPNEKALYIHYYLSHNFRGDESTQLAQKTLAQKGLTKKNKILLEMDLSSCLLGTNWEVKQSYQHALNAYKKFKNNFDLFSREERTYMDINMAYSFFSVEENEQAFDVIEKYIPILEQKDQYTLEDVTLINSILLVVTGIRKTAVIIQFSDILDRVIKKTPQFKKILFSKFNNLGQANIAIGNYVDALDAQLKAKEISDEFYPDQDLSTEWYWHMGWLSTETGLYDQADVYIQKAKNKIFTSYSEDSYDRFLITKVDFNNQIEKRDFDKALELLNQLKILDEKFDYFEGGINLELEEAYVFYYFNTKTFDQAIDKSEKIIDHLESIPSEHRRTNIMLYYIFWVKSLLETERFEEAKKVYQRGENLVVTYFKDNFTKDILAFIELKIHFLNLFSEKEALYQQIIDESQEDFYLWKIKGNFGLARLYNGQYHKNGAKKDLEKAKNHIQKAYAFNRKYANYIQSAKDKESYSSQSAELYQLAISIAKEWEKYVPSEAKELLFKYMDQPKYEFMRTNLELKLKGSQNPELAKSLKEKIQLKSRIASLTQSLLNSNSDEHDEKKKLLEKFQLEEKTLGSKIAHLSQKAGLLQEDKKAIPLKKLQKFLTNKQAFITYAQAENSMIGLLITSNETHSFSVSKAKTIPALINETYTALKQLDQSSTVKAGNQLYQLLLKPVEKYLEGKELFISPAESLYGLNFEILTKSPKVKSPDYLLYSHPIGYWYSAHNQLLFHDLERVKTSEKWAAFIPLKFQSDTLSEQPFIHQMAKNLSRKKQVQLYDHQNASKSKFLSMSSEYNKIILGTHTQINSQNPFESSLLFSDGESLNVEEIINHPFPQEFIILATCEGGISGSSKQGLANFSLANSFAFSGTQNLLMSQWKIDEKSTAKMLELFYFYLEKGMTASEALRKAKLDFISQAQDPKLKHPYYWGGLVIMGHDKAAKSYLFVYIILGALLITLGMAIGYKKLKNN